MKYTNGNANIWLDLQDGTRIIEYQEWYTGKRHND